MNTQTDDDFKCVLAIVNDYFHGLHFGDSQKLKRIFHPDAFLKAPGVRRSLSEWLSAVASREIPAQLNKPFSFKILSIEIIQDQAMVKLECPLFEHFYVDYLGLLKEQGQWLIVNKMYTDIQESKK